MGKTRVYDRKLIHRVAIAIGVLELIAYALSLFFSSGWKLFTNLPILHVFQIFIFAYAFLLRSEHAKKHNLDHFAVLNIVAVLLCLQAFIWIIKEAATCSALSDYDLELEQDCYEKHQAYSDDGTLGLECGETSDIRSLANDVCPQVIYGKAGGTTWIVFQFFYIIALSVTNVVLCVQAVRMSTFWDHGYNHKDDSELNINFNTSANVANSNPLKRNIMPKKMQF